VKKLILAEKPSVGKDIARVLGCKSASNGYIEGKDYVVTWALGHLVTLRDPEDYGEKYKSWKLDDLPIIPEKMELTVIGQTAKQYKTVKSLLIRKDISEIIIATDAGREGELVARWILIKSQVKKPLKRLWISSVTDKAIKEGFKKLKDGKEYINLYHSAQARAEADWIVGINATRALTTKFNAQLSCGRVQTPTLSIISRREKDIRSFKPTNFYGVNFMSEGVTFTWQDSKSGNTRIFDEESAKKIIASCNKAKKATVAEVTAQNKQQSIKGLYDLTSLQSDANKIFGFSAKETLSIMQKLYEHHKVLTYPRTDSKYISKDIVPTLPERLKAVMVKDYRKPASFLLSKPIKTNSSFVDDNKVSDHHAIIPTEESADFSDLSDKERKIYDLVVKRFLAVLYPPFEYEQTTVKISVDSHIFVAKGKRVINMGYKEIYSKNIDDDDSTDEVKSQSLPLFKKGQVLEVASIKQTTGKTTPPPFFTEGTLLEAMESPAKYMDSGNKELAKTLSETGGLGTVATRGDIIEKLLNSFLIEPRGNFLYTTAKGRQLLGLAPEDLRSPTLTAEWEQKLNRISKGSLNKDNFLNEIKAYTKDIIKEVRTSEATYKHDNITNKKCPECGKLMLEVKGKKGKYLVCQDRECGARKTLEMNTNARCPKCHKKLVLTGSDNNKKFVCVCGHKEKLETFEERRKKEGNTLQKKDVKKFMQKLSKENSKEEPAVNSKLAQALSGLKFE